MSSDSDIQIENGSFTRIHNAILEKIAKAHFSSREYSAVLFLLRKTYGYRTTTAQISGEQWEEGTGIKRQNVMASVAALVRRNIILQEGGGRGRGNVASYKFNKRFDTWDCAENESPSIHFEDDKMNPHQCNIDEEMNPHRFILDAENESPSMQENESPSMQCSSGLKKEKKKAAAAFISEKPKSKKAPSEFVNAYQSIWGELVPSLYIGEQITDWEQRVTIEGWRYALQECADTKHIGNWKYLSSILRRIEREGYQPPAAPLPADKLTTLNYAMEDL